MRKCDISLIWTRFTVVYKWTNWISCFHLFIIIIKHELNKNKDNGKDEVDDRRDVFTLAVVIDVGDVLEPYFSKLPLTRLENKPGEHLFHINLTILNHKMILPDWGQQTETNKIWRQIAYATLASPWQSVLAVCSI